MKLGKHIKKRILFLALLTVLFSGTLAANEMAAVWSRLYEKAETLSRKQAIMENIVDQHDRDLIPVLIEGLDELILTGDNLDSYNQERIYNDLMSMVIGELGYLKASEAADLVYRASVEAEDPFLRAKAISALGSMGARSYADEIALLLRNITMEVVVYDRMEETETVVEACLYTLERLKLPVGFRPVFMAYIEGFSTRTTKKAERAVFNIVEDPSRELQAIITGDDSLEVKLTALRVAEESSAPAASKAATARIALDYVLSKNFPSIKERTTASLIRMKALKIIRDSDVKEPQAVPVLDKALDSAEELNETLTVIQALGTFAGNEAAADSLVDYLKVYNDRMEGGIVPRDERPVRQTIISLGTIGHVRAKAELLRVQFGSWSGGTVRLARQTLEKLN